jgi:hypothetical protein
MTNESSNTLISTTLKQGKIYQDLQKKILDGSLEKNVNKKWKGKEKGKEKWKGLRLERERPQIKEEFTGYDNIFQSSEKNMPVAMQSFHTVLETSSGPDQIQELDRLQKEFDDLLKKYQDGHTLIMKDTNTYVSEFNNTKQGKNVYVNSIIDGAIANYLGVYKDSGDSMTRLSNGAQNYDFNSCMQAAISAGNAYFGLENVDITTNKAQCNIGNDLDAARQFGAATSGCQIGSDGLNYGAFNSNKTAIYTTTGSAFNGCYNNSQGDQSTGPIMFSSGPNMNSYSNVYVLGPYGIAPWGGISDFGSATYKNWMYIPARWIWNTPNANQNAPYNIGNPVTFIYAYNYTGESYLPATLYVMNDDHGVWYLNSNQIGVSDGGWDTTGNIFQITLSPGINYLQCSASNSGGPAGLIATVIDNNKNVLFTTNADWKFTNIPVSQMVINGSNFTVPTCQKYAVDNGYQYFGLLNGTTGTSQCAVSNSLQNATKYGSSNPVAIINSKNYGISGANAIYELDQKDSNPAFVGKMGYVNQNSELSEYPSSMIQPATTTGGIPTIKNADASCVQNAMPIDSIVWGQLKKRGQSMTSETKCGLSAAIDASQSAENLVKGQLAALADRMIQLINQMENQNQQMDTQMNTNSVTMCKNVKLYTTISQQFGEYKSLVNNNADSMISDSNNLVTHDNFQYIFWGILAVTIIIITSNTIIRR